ncbi:MAG: hypothetical protein WBN14_13105 [Polyangiales bacterium]
MLIRPLITCVTLLSVIACGGAGEVRRTGGTFAARGPGCEYRVIRNRIVEPYEEVGVVDIDAFSVRQLPPSEERFRKVVNQFVCGLGGHAVIPTIDMHGRWVHGTIIRFRPSECDRCRTEGIMREIDVVDASESGGQG